ncbi:Uncharacterized conserved protein%2C contains double-stranded beta-helix domain [Bordetella pertussis]|uniref:Cupin type-2 domain-containing protein n=1 Tax=Bordetella pertussis (strain ATCC 9797 / DSM 5571 / CCUG 30873 / LMG 14455 / NCTC 10739 / 18323) TaxID=568706 RepID=A0A0T7CL40_BORP1|nr:cupin domain-containing protein [Bordetella pertussis]AZR84111.1 hypothetical protein BBB37_04710 [Bordetella pertussis]PNP05162.1 cupin domain-containing protein [Bordetella pertussis 18323]UEB59611.1 cupin domain-containing protein [Bordetella pertussis]CCJ62339.1 conserved hypothetical protein [Bordetella pertussis 18323]CFP51896.1 Uncharacterized conserved protein%2C contains double-stranded beta-helix domain [Bordetella pertussis]
MKQQHEPGIAVVVGPDEGDSFWQPVPANGFVRTLLNRANTGASVDFSAGTQTVAPGCHVREHFHDDREEVIFITEGTGTALIDGVEHPLAPGACLFLGKSRKHSFLNAGPEPLSFFWILMPGGLDDFFRQIGRMRQPGEPAPQSFARPADIDRIEANTVFGWTAKS